MAQRDPVIEIVDYHNGLSWKCHPEEIKRYLEKMGIQDFKAECHRQLDIALNVAIRTNEVLSEENE